MKNSKLTTLLDTFSVEEWKAFRAYIKSPYFNVNPLLCSLFDLFDEKRNNLKRRYPAKADVWEDFFAGEKYDETRLLTLMSRLNRHAEQFLAQKNWDSRRHALNASIISALERKELFKHQTKYLENDFDFQASVQSSHSLLDLYELASVQNKERAIVYLDIYYKTQFWKDKCNSLASSGNDNSDLYSLKVSEPNLNNASADLSLIERVYYSCYKMLKDGFSPTFSSFIQSALINNGDGLKDDARSIFNFWFRAFRDSVSGIESDKIDLKHFDFIRHAYSKTWFELDKGRNWQKLTISDFSVGLYSKLPDFLFVIEIALSINEEKWVSKLSENCSWDDESQFQNWVWDTAQARRKMAINNFSEAENLFRKWAEFQSKRLSVLDHVNWLLCLVALKNWDEAYLRASALKVIVRKTQWLQEVERTSILSLVKLIKKFEQATLKKDEKQIQQIYKSAEELPFRAAKAAFANTKC